MSEVTFRKSAGRWAVYMDETRIGSAWDNGARKSYLRNWTWRSSDGTEGRASSRRSCGDALKRHTEQEAKR